MDIVLPQYQKMHGKGAQALVMYNIIYCDVLCSSAAL
jgi:hypothetical protein